MVERRERARLEDLERRVTELEQIVRPMQKDRDGVVAVLSFSQKLAGMAVVMCAIGGFVLQVVR